MLSLLATKDYIMIESMTGFAEALLENEEYKISIALKSLNSKGSINISYKLPTRYFAKETEINRLISRKLKRGKISLQVNFEIKKADSFLENLNITELKAFAEVLKKIKTELNLADELTLDTIIKFSRLGKEMLLTELSESEWNLFSETLKMSIERLLKIRREEGRLLYEDFQKKINVIQEKWEKIRTLLPERDKHFADKIRENLFKFNKEINYSQERFEEQLLYYLDKYDLNEELVRFEAQLNKFSEIMETEPPNGQKLNFYFQEMWREITTLNNKANYLPLQNEAIGIKEILSQIKEQLSNVA